MKRACLLLGLLGACSGHEPSIASKEPAPNAEVDAADGPATAWHWEGAVAGGASHYLLGVVGQAGVQQCPEDDPFEVTWKSLRPTIGRVDISGPSDAVFESLMDKPALARGQPLTDSHPESTGAAASPCAPIQMRSDWRPTPRGILIERSPSPRVGHFEVTAVRALHEVTARADGEHVIVQVTNPVPVELSDVELRVHYEGCFGKPGTTTQAESIGTLGVGAQISARMPQRIERDDAPKRRGRFVARSVHLVASAESVVVDLDIPLGVLGVELSCPGRGRK